MPCQVCGHTIQNLGVPGKRLFWCPRCGTLTDDFGDRQVTEKPHWMNWDFLGSSFTLFTIQRGGPNPNDLKSLKEPLEELLIAIEKLKPLLNLTINVL